MTAISRSLLFILLFLFVCPSATGAREGMTLAVHPYLAASELIDRFTPLAKYLSEQLDMEVSIELSRDYAEHIQKIGDDEVEIAYMGPASYVQMVDTYGEKPLLARIVTAGSPTIQGVIIVRSDAPLKRLADLKGKYFAFGDPQSTMGHLVPRYMLQQEGIGLEDLSGYAFISNHHNVALGVLMGDFDAGAVKEEIFEEFRLMGIRELVRTPAVAEHLFVTSSRLPPETVAALKRHLFTLEETSQGLSILDDIQEDITGMAPVADEDYNELRRILRQLEDLGLEIE